MKWCAEMASRGALESYNAARKQDQERAVTRLTVALGMVLTLPDGERRKVILDEECKVGRPKTSSIWREYAA
jgi:hypothetical protein